MADSRAPQYAVRPACSQYAVSRAPPPGWFITTSGSSNGRPSTRGTDIAVVSSVLGAKGRNRMPGRRTTDP